MTIQWETVGTNRYPLMVVDNFYRNPEHVRQLAHSLDFENPNGRHTHSSATLAQSTREIYQFLREEYAEKWRVTELLGRVDQWRFYRSLRSRSTMPTRREDPHSDWEYLLAGLIYLTPDQYCRGGTGFYRHRKTGAEEKLPPLEWLLNANVPPSIIQRLNDFSVYRAFEESEIEDYRQFLASIPFKTKGNKYHLTASNEKWELTRLVEMKFNRLIMYPAFSLHKAIYEEDWFDDDVTKRRLTQNFFFKFPTD